MTTPTIHRPIAVLNLPAQVPVLISVAKAVALAMTNNAAFPAPTPTLAALNTALVDLEVAEAAAQARTKGAIASRNQKRDALASVLEQLRAYVQSVADADRPRAAALIQSAAMNVRKVTLRAKRAFGVEQGSVSGAVTLVTASAARRASYEWEVSSDTGKTWQVLPPTLQTKTAMTGLQSGATYSFRYRSVTKAGAADWSQPLSLLVK